MHRALILAFAVVTLAVTALPAGADILTKPFELAQIAALPRMTSDSPAAQRINANLAARDAAALKEAADCTLPTDEGGSQVVDQTGYYDRSVEVPMAGPDFLSILITDETYCPGAAHGATRIAALTFDLATGRPVDWPALLPPDWTRHRLKTWPDDPSWLWSQSLVDFYHSHYPRLDDPDCAPIALAVSPAFQFALNARSHQLVMIPRDSSHATRACDDWVSVALVDLAKRGADPRLIAALTGP
jgi:hypothetical protein